MNSKIELAQLALVGEQLNQLLRRVGIVSKPKLALNAKIKRTYPKKRLS